MNEDYKKCYSPASAVKNEFGEGYYQVVIETDQISCGEIHVPPHAKAGYDAGHQDADEVFFVVSGTATVHFPNSGEAEDVPAGCYIMMPRSTPHTVANNTDQALTLTFSCVKK